MLATLSSVKARLQILDTDTTYDALLTAALLAVSARFDLECNRTLARTIDAVHEFPADDLHIPVPCYPIETVTKFELQDDTGLWLEVPSVPSVLRNRCVISLPAPLSAFQHVSVTAFPAARVIYTGGYILPGDPDPDYQQSTLNYPPVRLPADVERAAIEQVIFWFQTRDQVGTIRIWPTGGNYVQFADIDLMPQVRAVLRRHTRFLL